MLDLNASTQSYLKQYLAKDDPGFAIMLTAPWGAGKTHLIKALVENIEVDKPLYISLFGVATRAEFDRAIVRAYWPKSDGDVGKLARQAKNLLSSINILGNSVNLNSVDLTEVIISRLPKTLIFDDLERATLSASEILGAINNFVEHEGKRVVLLAHEVNLWDAKTLKEKEKVIGRTLAIVADIDSALGSIIARFGKEIGAFYRSQIDTITEVFRKAGYNNLRSLGQALWEFERLFNEIDNQFLENQEGMRELLFVFLALSLELKSGNFSREDMQLRGGMDFGNKPSYAKLRLAQKKYGSEQIQHGRHQTVLPYKFAESVLCDGAIDKSRINETLAQTPAFHEAAAESEWETVCWAFDREKRDVELAVVLMEEKFANREYLEPGVILHVFACRLELEEMGFTKLSMKEIENQCSQYIKDLKKRELLTPYDPALENENESGYGYSSTGYKNLRFPQSERSPLANHFSRLYHQLKTAQLQLYENTEPLIAQSLLELMETNLNEFVLKVSGNRGQEATFARRPILKHLPAGDFADSMLALPQKERKQAFKSISERFEKPGKDLDTEKTWFADLAKELEDRISGMDAFSRWQTSIDFKHSIGKVLANWKDVAAEIEAEKSNHT